MAFRRFRRSYGRRSGYRGRRSGWSNKKWIGYHNYIEVNTVERDPVGAPGIFETPPIFVPLVSADDYGESLPEQLLTSQVERQERARVLRSVGTFSALDLNIIPEPGTGFYMREVWWYFAAIARDAVGTAISLDVTSGFGIGTDQYHIGLSPPPGLWRQPIKKFGYDLKLAAASQASQGADDPLIGSYHQETTRSWDFRPNAPIQIPMEWYLVLGVTHSYIVDPRSSAVGFIIGARTLITD